jgi:hypothetical protein
MKILFASRSILPARSGSAFIVEKLAQNFSKDELVVFGEKGIFNASYTRTDEVPKFYYCASKLNLNGRGDRFFNFFRWLLFPYVVYKLNRIVQEEKVDYILGIFPDNFYCYAALKVAKKNKLPFSSYFHNTYLENRKGYDLKFAKKVQQEIFSASEHIFVMSEGMEKFYKAKYGLNKFKPLVHAFNKYPNLPTTTSSEIKKVWNLVMVGNFNRSNIEATARFVSAVKKDSRFTISIYTPVPKLLLKARGVDVTAINYKGFISDDLLPTELQKYDIFVLTHGFKGAYDDVEYQTIFPTRTIPLLVSGKPIFAHSPKGAFLSDFIRKYDCAQLVDEPSEEKIIASLEEIIQNPLRAEQLKENARKTAAIFYGPNVAAYLKNTLKKG